MFRGSCVFGGWRHPARQWGRYFRLGQADTLNSWCVDLGGVGCSRLAAAWGQVPLPRISRFPWVAGARIKNEVETSGPRRIDLAPRRPGVRRCTAELAFSVVAGTLLKHEVETPGPRRAALAPRRHGVRRGPAELALSVGGGRSAKKRRRDFIAKAGCSRPAAAWSQAGPCGACAFSGWGAVC